MCHTIYQTCFACGGAETNKVRFLFGEFVDDGEIVRGGKRKLRMWSSECRLCGKKDGKNFE